MLKFQRRGIPLHEVWHPLALLLQRAAQVASVPDQLLRVSVLLHHIPSLRQSATGVHQDAVLQTVDAEFMQSNVDLVWLPIIDKRMIWQAQPHPLRYR